MTPAVQVAKSSGIKFALHEYEHRADAQSHGEEVASGLGISQDDVYKTMIVVIDKKTKEMAVGIVPVSKQLDFRALAKAAGTKKASLAPIEDAERTTGYIAGGTSPLGQKTKLPTFIDESIYNLETVYVSAGKRGLQIELAPQDLIELTDAKTAAISR